MAHPVDIYVGIQIRELRRKRGFTQERLAQKIGVKFQQIQKYETAQNRVSASRLYAVSEALDTDIHLFFPTRRGASTRSG